MSKRTARPPLPLVPEDWGESQQAYLEARLAARSRVAGRRAALLAVAGVLVGETMLVGGVALARTAVNDLNADAAQKLPACAVVDHTQWAVAERIAGVMHTSNPDQTLVVATDLGHTVGNGHPDHEWGVEVPEPYCADAKQAFGHDYIPVPLTGMGRM